MNTLTPEDFGLDVANAVNGNEDFKRAVDDLGGDICDELIREKVTKLRVKAEKDLGITFADEEKHYDFAMNFEGELCRHFAKALVKYINEY